MPNHRPPAYSQEESSFDLSMLILPLARAAAEFWRRRVPLMIIGLAVGVAAGRGLARFFQPNAYKATALFEMMPSPMRLIMEPLLNRPDQTVGGRALEKENEQFEKNRLLEQQTKKSDEKEKEEKQAAVTTYQALIRSPQVHEMTRIRLAGMGIKETVGMGDVVHVAPTNLLELQVAHPDPHIAYQAANAWAQSVVDHLTNLNTEQFQEGKSYFWTQYRRSKKEIEAIQSKVLSLKDQAQFELTGISLAAKKDKLIADMKELETIKIELISNERSLPVLEKFLEQEIENDPTIMALKNNPSRLKIKEKLLKQLYRNPSLAQGIVQQIDGVEKIPEMMNPSYARLVQEIKQKLQKQAILKPRKTLLEESVTVLTEEVTHRQTALTENTLKLASLEKDLEIARKQNEIIFGKISEAELASALRFADLKLVSYSSLPEEKLPAPVKKFTKLGALWGLLLGYALSFFLNRSNGSGPTGHPENQLFNGRQKNIKEAAPLASA